MFPVSVVNFFFFLPFFLLLVLETDFLYLHQFLFLSVQFLGRTKTSLSTSVFKSTASKVIYLWKGYSKILVGFLKEFKCMWKTHPEVYLTSKNLVSIQKLPMNESTCFPSFNSCLKMSLPEGIPQNSRCGSHLYFNTNITSCSDCGGSA